jgi:hypothetical protein
MNDPYYKRCVDTKSNIVDYLETLQIRICVEHALEKYNIDKTYIDHNVC